MTRVRISHHSKKNQPKRPNNGEPEPSQTLALIAFLWSIYKASLSLTLILSAIAATTKREREREMVSLKLQKRLSASVLKCGRGKVWIDPNEVNEISMANSRTLSLSLSRFLCLFHFSLYFLSFRDLFCYVDRFVFLSTSSSIVWLPRNRVRKREMKTFLSVGKYCRLCSCW
jgi:hypothetical protein